MTSNPTTCPSISEMRPLKKKHITYSFSPKTEQDPTQDAQAGIIAAQKRVS